MAIKPASADSDFTVYDINIISAFIGCRSNYSICTATKYPIKFRSEKTLLIDQIIEIIQSV